MAATLEIAAVHYRAIPCAKTANISSLVNLVREAAVKGAKIIVLPEMCTTGLAIERLAQAEILAETVPGPATDAFAELALRYRVHIVLGLAESDPAAGKFYNSQVVLGPDGQIKGNYRKMHLFGPDLDWASVGDLGYQAVATEWGGIGLGICCDINYWELMSFLAESKVAIFAFSTNWVGEELPFRYWSEMVAGGGYYLVAANNWGEAGEIRFSGGSTIQSPDLSVLATSDAPADGVIYASITPWPPRLPAGLG